MIIIIMTIIINNFETKEKGNILETKKRGNKIKIKNMRNVFKKMLE